MMRSFVLPLAAFVAMAGLAFADPPADAPIVPDGIRGALVICGGGPLPESIRKEFVELAGGEDAKLVVIPSACDDPDLPVVSPALADLWKARGIKDVTVFHTRDAAEANDEKFVEPLRKATAVWIGGGKQTLLAKSYSGTLVQRELQALLDRGGVIGGTSAGAACQSKVMIVRAKVWETPGFDLIPGAIVDQHFLVRNRKQRLLDVLAQYPTHVGLGVDEAAALVVRGRTLKCVGEGTVTLCLAASKNRPVRETVLKPGDTADFTALRRAARARQGEPFPPETVGPPAVKSGSLVIVGGGGMPVEVVEKFIELAGGPEAPIVVLPTAVPDPSSDSREGKIFERFGAKHVTTLAAHTPAELAAPAFLKALEEAKGVWFGGGRQWRFVDAYDGTPAI
ncbi:MAG TPA: cyanophycinase, partial [Planctomycetaceae bacterium]|nr:cyanophycinase [Planctomycetaceae bacterium]